MRYNHPTTVTRKQAKVVRRLAKRGLSIWGIAQYEGMPAKTTVAKIVQDYRNGEDTYDPYIDEVAVWRTLQGDAKAGSRLTRFEQEHVIQTAKVAGEHVDPALAARGLGLTLHGLNDLLNKREARVS